MARKFGCLLDYPEPDTSDFNADYFERRDRLPESNQPGFVNEAATRLKAQMYEERRQGWNQRAFNVLEHETAISVGHLNDCRAKLTAAMAEGDDSNAHILRQRVDYFEKQVADRQAHRVYLEDLFAQYPGEDAFLAEINRIGRAHLEWAQQTQDKLRELLDWVAKIDLDAPVEPGDWDRIAAEIAAMKTRPARLPAP